MKFAVTAVVVSVLILGVILLLASCASAAGMSCRLVSEERLSVRDRACRYHCAAGVDHIVTVRGVCPRYIELDDQ